MEEALENAARTSEVLARLSKCRKHLKQSTKLRKHKFDWQLEKVSMNNEVAGLEAEIARHFETARLNGKTKNQPKNALIMDEATKRRQLILQEALAVLDKGPDEANKCEEEQPATDDELWREILEQEMEWKRERAAWGQQQFAQAFGIRAVISKIDGNDSRQEMAELIYAARMEMNQMGESLYQECMEATRGMMEAKASLNRALQEQDEDQVNEEGGSSNDVNFTAFIEELESFGHGYEDSEPVIRAIEDAQQTTLSLAEKFENQLNENSLAKHSFLKEKENMIAAQTWFGDLEHDIFTKLFREILGKGRVLQIFFERAQLELPNKTKQELESHLRWFEKGRKLNQTKKDILMTRERAFVQLKTQLLSEIRLKLREADDERCRRGEVEQLEQHRAEIQARLQDQRRKAQIRLAILEEERKKREDRERQEQEYKAALEAMERERKKELVIEYHRQKFFEQALEKLHEEQQKQEEEEIRRKMAPIHKMRVDFREQERLERLEQERLRAQISELEEQQREQALAKLKETVPYFNKLQEIVPSKERLESSTFASACVPDAAYKNYNAEGLFKPNGFTSDRICNDVRFKVVEALRSKGLQHSNYAQTLIRTMANVPKNLQTTF